MKSLLLLMVVPVVLGGGPEFMKMWSEMEKEVDKAMAEPSGSGSAMAGGDMAAGMPKQDNSDAEMMKKMQEMMGWSEGKKQEPMKGESEEAMKGWSDEAMKGWSDDAMKGWSDDAMKGWSEEQMKGWSEEQMKGWGEQQRTGWSDEKVKKMFVAFQAYLKAKREEMEAAKAAEEKAHMKQAVMNFQEYMHKKHYEEKQEEEAKQALKKKMLELKMKHMLVEKMTNMTVEYDHQKSMFKSGITHHFLDFCHTCESKKSVLMRLKDGNFGYVDQMPSNGAGNNRTGGGSGSASSNRTGSSAPNGTNSGSYNSTASGYSNGTGNGSFNGTMAWSSNMTDNYADAAAHKQMKQAFVHSLMHKNHKEQVEFVLNHLIDTMCTASEHFLTYLAECEEEYARQMQNHRH